MSEEKNDLEQGLNLEERQSLEAPAQLGLFALREERIAWIVCALLIGCTVSWLVLSKPPASDALVAHAADQISLVQGGVVRVPRSNTLWGELSADPVRVQHRSSPLLHTTGTVVAKREVDTRELRLSTPDLLQTYSGWMQAKADVVFHSHQLHSISSLGENRIRTQTQLVDRLRQLVEIGSDSRRELATEEANLQEQRLEAERAKHEAESELLSAQRRQTALDQELEQVGVNVEALETLTPGQAFVVAELPESRSRTVRDGMSCRVFLGMESTDAVDATLVQVLPTVSQEQRTVRLLLRVSSAEQLRSGQYVNVDLGTEPRDAQVVLATAIVHVGDDDFMFVQRGDDSFVITEVQVGDSSGDDVEVHSPRLEEQKVLTRGAILLKPLLAEFLSRSESDL